MQTGFLRLAFERLKLTLNLGSDVVYTGKVSIHLSKLSLAFCFAFFMLQNASSLFNESATILWARRKNGIQVALRNNGIGTCTHAGVVEDVKNIHATYHIAIDQVLAFAATVHTAPN